MLWRDLRAWQVYGANTDVGKTIWSTILAKALARRAPANGLLYLKPVSTGPHNEADDRHLQKYVPGILSKCISQFTEPVSPHLAARDFASVKRIAKTDPDILAQVKKILNNHSESGGRYALLETAGGVLSPAPSGSVQADLYRPLRLPTILIGDSRLGGISSTLSAFESLNLRGYDIESVLLFNDPKWGNYDFLREHFDKQNINTFALPMPPPKQAEEKDDQVVLSEYYEQCSSSAQLNELVSLLQQKHFSRVSKLTSMPAHADSVIWHPFRQHQLQQNTIAIDSAYGDHFEAYDAEQDQALKTPESSSPSGLTPLSSVKPQPSITAPLFDASASWWTQGLGHGNPTLAATAAYAAGRYGHVMFANAVHEPALDLSYNLLSTLANPRLSRVFFTDNGSTGMEVAVKMALRATCYRYGWNKNDSNQPIGILGLQGSYHGDTIGVMNCSEPSTFNEKVDWYRPWGHWFEPPSVRMIKGEWQITIPASMQPDRSKTYQSLESIFDYSSRAAEAEFYKAFIIRTLTELVEKQNLRFGALILEPLVMGAGGMIFVDPLFQRTLITTIREHPELIAPQHTSTSPTSVPAPTAKSDPTAWSGLPFIADEVFTGLYRLGRASSSSFLTQTQPHSQNGHALDLQVAPDISVHAKLLTGGLLPLALTTASQSIFNTFLSDSKADALLHGHSYTAHPIGCAVANKSLDELNKLHSTPAGLWSEHKRAWHAKEPSASSPGSKAEPEPVVYSFYDPDMLVEMSKHARVQSCFAVGSVLALTLRSEGGGAGYSSNAAASLQARLLARGDDGTAVHSRVLGDVIYFMTSLVTLPEAVRKLEGCILDALDEDV